MNNQIDHQVCKESKCLNKNLWYDFLKAEREDLFFISSGILFQSFAPEQTRDDMNRFVLGRG